MKKIIVLLLICTFAVQLTGQPSTHAQEQRQQQRSQKYKQIQSAKIAFFTASLELTPKEAEEFWPLYNEYWRAREIANRESHNALRTIDKLLSSGEKVTESQLKKLIDTYLSGSTTESNIHKEYYQKFIKIFPVKKVAKMYLTEEEFRIKMIHQLRSGGRASAIDQNN